MMCKKNVAVRVYTWQQHFYGTGDMMGVLARLIIFLKTL